MTGEVLATEPRQGARQRREAADVRPRAEIRPLRVNDGLALWRLVRATEVLDENSLYAYLMTAEHFGSTSLVAEQEGEVVGMVTAFRPPQRPEVVFVWQVGVHPGAQGQGLGGRLLRRLLAAEACDGVRYLETNVTPSNQASRALFRSLARKLGTDCEVLPGFGPELFEGTGHEPEDLLRIGPLGGGPRGAGPEAEE